MTDPTPPRWAEHLLAGLLPPEDRRTVAGDLLEEYRVSVLAARGEAAADAWYLRQVAGFAWRAALPWALVFSAAYVGRVGLDWIRPPEDFHTRATVTTALSMGILTVVAARAAWRTGLARSGTVSAIAVVAVSALTSTAGVAVLLAARHDVSTWNAIAWSGGLDEALTLPFGMLLPAAVIGMIGGAAGAMSRRIVGGVAKRR